MEHALPRKKCRTLPINKIVSNLHKTKGRTLEIGRFKGRYIYEGKATDLRITEIDAASFFQGRRPKARPKSVKTFLVGRNWLPWAAAKLLPRKNYAQKQSRNLPAEVAQPLFA